jgi:hypothetical protein
MADALVHSQKVTKRTQRFFVDSLPLCTFLWIPFYG